MKRGRDIGEYFGGGKKVKNDMCGEEKKVGDVIVESVDGSGEVVLSEIKQKFRDTLSEEEKELLKLEIEFIEDSWFEALIDVFTEPWFLDLKRFVEKEYKSNTVYPPAQDIYSWSQLTPLNEVKCIIIGQDPYHGPNQAHGLAFSVKGDTKIPPSLRNIYKGVKVDYPDFDIPTGGDLTGWAKQGVLLLNTVLTVRAGNANSHAKQGWERFTREVLARALDHKQSKLDTSKTQTTSVDDDGDAVDPIVVVAWGKHAERVVGQVMDPKTTPRQSAGDSNIHAHHAHHAHSHAHVHVLRGCHPSPLSAHRGFFDQGHFKATNKVLAGGREVDWKCL